MSDVSDEQPQAKKGGKGKKIILLGLGALLLIGGGIGAGVYAGGGLSAGGAAAKPAVDPNQPQLVLKGQGRGADGEAGEGAEGGPGPSSAGAGGEKYESTYFQIEKEFTSNLKDSPRFVQIGLGVVTHYDNRVIDNLRRHEIPVRSAVLLALSGTDETTVFTPDGKAQLQKALTKAINDVLKQKEGFGGIADVYFTNFIVQ